ncbi:MAG: heparan-alpha-glucosaminide N-acetyltransferase domain-containing protein [Longimicrobiaceae bacterium]
MTARSDGPPRQRVESVDVVRGVIMVLMALDHTRDFFGGSTIDPTNLATTTAPLFFTRWITHFCAPVFCLLTGTGAYLGRRSRTPPQLSGFLLTRGLWLVFLELTVARFLWQFNLDYQVTIITVLWALGWSMVALAALVRFPTWVAAVVGGAMILLHNLADPVQAASFGSLAPLWNVLHAPGVLYAAPGRIVILAYPLVPWIGVMAVGYALGAVFGLEAGRRRRLLLRMGLVLTAAFLVLRFANVYGDPVPWSAQRTGTLTLLSFLNLTKYPPSLLFLLMTLGPALLLLRAVDGRTPPAILRPALVIGKVPMFYYLAHILLLHLVALLFSYARYGTVRYMFESTRPDQFPVTQPPGWANPLPVVYLLWMLVVVLLYPFCRWYAGLKARSTHPLLSYL